MTTTLQALSLVKKASRSKFASHYTWGANGVCECKMDVKSTWIPTWHQMDHVFMVIWTIFKNHLLEVGLTLNRETMALQMLTSIHLFYFIMCEDLLEWKFIEIVFGWGPGHILHTTFEGLWPHYMILEVSWDGFWTLSFGLSQFHGHGSWLMCEVVLSVKANLWVALSKHYPSRKCGQLFYFKNNWEQWQTLSLAHISMFFQT